MIPILYDKTGAVKIGDLIDSIECYVEEERNGIFELTMVYPANTTLLDSICYENIIVVDANDYLKNQKFRIYNTRKLMSNRIEICARHISFDLAHDWIDALSINNQSCEYVLNMIFKNSQFSSHFKGHSDIVNAQDYAINETTCLNAIGGSQGSILDTFGTGAEILRDNTDIHVLNRRGSDNDVSIEYRKNLTGLEVEEDTTDLVTRILPYATYTDVDSNEIKVKGSFVDSSLINNYAHPYVKYIDYSEKPHLKIKLPEFLGGVSLNIPKIPKLWKGSNYTKGGLTLVGEQGPELVNMPRGASVTPAHKTEQMLNNASGSVELVLKIDNFYNNTANDIEKIADELAYLIRRKKIALGGV